MVELVVKVPKKLKERMSKLSRIDWSSVAVKAISERMKNPAASRRVSVK